MTHAASVMSALEAVAARGAEGLVPEARAELVGALLGLRCQDGGFAGLDGRSDLYFTFFAWLSLRALGAPADRDSVCRYCACARRLAAGVERCCASVILAREGRGSPWAGWCDVLRFVARGRGGLSYDAFLGAWAADALMGGVPRWLARWLWRRQTTRAWDRLPTPQLAALAALAASAGAAEPELKAALGSRRVAGAGWCAAEGAAPDLLATAVSRFALDVWQRRLACEAQGPGAPAAAAADLAFVEACWMDDGLFGAAPDASRGDAEQTFYGLLALGTCR